MDTSLLDEDARSGTYSPAAPPSPAPAAAPPKARLEQRPAAAPAKPKKRSPLVMVIGGAAVVALVALGLFFWLWTRKPAFDPKATRAAMTQATALAQKGQLDSAIALLQDIKPEDPQHDKALEMIADLQHRKAQSSELVDGRPAAKVFQELLANGKAAFDGHDYMGAKKALEDASRIRPLPPDMKQTYDAASQQVAKLDSAIALFREQKYQDAIAYLQQLNQQDPQNQNIKQLLLNAHFDLGVNNLQQDKRADAIKEFDQVLQGNPNDDLAKRSRELALRYEGKQPDLLFKIYVKYLPLR
jgi:tetratricopeptide (TPR) repeat protein